MAKTLSWKPVARGKLYCSPACGRGCTKNEHNEALRSGKALAKRLGPGWIPVVWENLGWHFKAQSPCRRFEVYKSRHGALYTAYLNKAGESGGMWAEHARTPRAAVLKAYAKGKAFARLIASIVAESPPVRKAKRR